MATAPPRSDAALLERLRERDRSAWDELYRLYEGRLYGFAYRLCGNPHDAADLVQETFVRALPRLDRLPPERADIGAYLFATAKNLFLKSVERGKRQQPVEEVPEPDEPTAIDEDPQRAAFLRRQQAEVRIANGKLAPRQRLVLALRELEDRSYAEIGEIVGLNENAVAQLISRARQSLREELRLVQVDRSRLPAACQGYLPLLSAHLDGQLKGPKLAETLGHLDRCEHCQAALADMREASRRYRALVPPLVGLAALREGIDDALGASGYWQPPRLGLRAALHGRTAVVAVAAGLAGFGALGGGVAYLAARDGAPQPAVVAPAATSATPQSVAPTPAGTTAPAAASSTAAATTTATATAATNGTTAQETEATTAAETTMAVDVAGPTVTIAGAPDDPTTETSATFALAAGEGGVSFACRLDGGGFEPCTTRTSYFGLAPGKHTFSARAADAAGNAGPSVAYSWTIEAPPATTETGPPPDTTPPTVTITDAPASEAESLAATFAFTASEPASFRCSLDGGTPAPCTSPRTYSGLDEGRHTFTVEATDEAGNPGVPASYAWAIAVPDLPDLVITSLDPFSVTVKNVGAADAGAFAVKLDGVVTVFFTAGLPAGASETRSWTACLSGTITAVADALGQVAESSEGNNSASTENLC